MVNEFTLYGVMDKLTGKLVSNLTNPRHKYWETRKTAENAVRNFMSRRYNADRQLEVARMILTDIITAVFGHQLRDFTDSIISRLEQYFDNCLEVTKRILDGRKYSAKIYDDYNGHDFDEARYLWKDERARLQGVPEEYVKNISEKDAADVLGDGWTVPVIAHIFSFMKF